MSRLYVGRIPPGARERDLDDLFGRYGRVRSVELKSGFGYIEFDRSREAEDAMDALDGRSFMGEKMIVERAKPRGGVRGQPSWVSKYGMPERTRYRVLVTNLSSRAKWQDLKDHFRHVGLEVTFAEVNRTRPGEGVVEFGSRDDVKYAIRKCDDTEFEGRRIRVEEDRGDQLSDRGGSRSPRRERPRSRSRSRSPRKRSRSGSRNRSRSPRDDGKREEKKEEKRDGEERKDEVGGKGEGEKGEEKARSRSRSRSPSPKADTKRDLSASPPPRSRSRSPSPADDL